MVGACHAFGTSEPFVLIPLEYFVVRRLRWYPLARPCGADQPYSVVHLALITHRHSQFVPICPAVVFPTAVNGVYRGEQQAQERNLCLSPVLRPLHLQLDYLEGDVANAVGG